MIYRIYIYATYDNENTDVSVALINNALKLDSYSAWKDSNTSKYMKDFDVGKIKKEIETVAKGRCQVQIRQTWGKEQKEYLNISTSYEVIKEIIHDVYLVAAENDLKLFDAETKQSFYLDPIDNRMIIWKLRKKEIVDAILAKTKPVWRLRTVFSREDELGKMACFLVTLKKTETSFLERTAAFYECLEASLKEDEVLICKDRSFVISGEWYTITILLEGYKGNADMIGYFENGSPKCELLRRMSTEFAIRWVENEADELEKKDIYARMWFREMVNTYPNPGDRFVSSVKITKWQRKQVFGLRYSGIEGYGSEIIFHIVPEFLKEESGTISALKIEEESASFFLPFIEDIYPYIYDRYFSEKNYIPAEMWKEIINRIKEARFMVLYDTYCLNLPRYVERFNLHVFGDHTNTNYWETGDGYRINSDPITFVYNHRYEIAYLYDVFIQWAEVQMQLCYDDDYGIDRMFNIMGP